MSSAPALCAVSFAAGVAEGRRLAAVEMSVRLKQVGLDFVIDAERGAVILGNASGPGSIAAVGQ